MKPTLELENNFEITVFNKLQCKSCEKDLVEFLEVKKFKNPVDGDARKMLLESGSFMQPKNELGDYTGGKQAKSLLQESKQPPGLLGGGRRAPSLYCLIGGFYLLKMGGTNVGSRKMWFFPIGLA